MKEIEEEEEEVIEELKNHHRRIEDEKRYTSCHPQLMSIDQRRTVRNVALDRTNGKVKRKGVPIASIDQPNTATY